MKTKMIRRILLAVAMLCFGAMSSQASTITYYVDVFGLATATTTPIATASATLGDPGTSVDFTIPKLNQLSDPNAGYMYVLTAVSITVNWISQGEVDVYNNSGSTNYGFTNASTSIPLTLTVDGVTDSPVATAGPTSGTATHGTVTPFGSLSGTGTQTNSSADLAQFQGWGNQTIDANMTSGMFTAGGTGGTGSAGHLFFGGLATAGAVAVFQYTFTEQYVPEPVTSALVGGALVGVALLARRKRVQKA
jgi:hypothetical protein